MHNEDAKLIARSISVGLAHLSLVHRAENRALIRALHKIFDAKDTGVRFNYRVGPVTLKPDKRNPMDIVLTNEQQVVVRLAPVSAKGKPVALDGKPVWTVSLGSCTVVPADDGLSCTIVSGEDAGDSEVTVSADADLGEGVVTISDAIRVTVNGAQAQSLGLTADAPTTKP